MRLSFKALQLNMRLTLLVITDICLIILLLRPGKDALKQALVSIQSEYKAHPIKVLSASDSSALPGQEVPPQRAYGMFSVLNTPPKRLKSNRIRKLQGKVLHRVLFSLYSIRPTAGELKVLGTIESLSWICVNLQKSAGIRPGEELTQDKLTRIQFVFRAFTAGLSLNSPPGPAKFPSMRRVRKLFPSSVKKAVLNNKREQRELLRNSLNTNHCIRYEALRFHLFLEMQNLMLLPESRNSGRTRINQFLRRLHG